MPVKWPDPQKVSGNEGDAELELFKAKLEIQKTKYSNELTSQSSVGEADREREKADFDNHYKILQEFYKGYIEIAKGQIDKAIERADFVQKVAVAIGTAYVGVLALRFSVAKDAQGGILPETGIFPTLFLGISFFLAAFFVGFITKPKRIFGQTPRSSLRGSQRVWRNNFVKWTRDQATKRRFALQASIISLGVGIAFLPVPFTEIKSEQVWPYVWWGLGAIIVIPLVVGLLERDR